MKHIYTLLFLLLTGNLLVAQSTVNGKIYDANTKEPLIGVIVQSKNSSEITTTNSGGLFNLSLTEESDSLTISYIGYEKQIISVNESDLNIGLTQEIQNLQTLVVSANRGVQKRKDVPATINTISARAIQETNSTQMNQILNQVPGLVMKDLNNEQHMMSIRQPMTSRPYFLYLEDGLPIAPVGNFNHNQLIEVNMLGIRTVEVLKGPSSSIYGSNAIGGAINFITQSPSAVPTAKIGYQQNTYGYQRLEFFGGGYPSEKLGISIGGYAAKQRDGWQSNSDFDKLSLSAKGVYHFNNRTDLTAYITSNYLDTQTGGSIDSVGFYSRKYLANNDFAYRKVNALRGRMTLEHRWNSDSEINFSLYTGKSAIAQNPRYRIKNIDSFSASGQENEDSYTNYGILIQQSQSFNFLNSKLIAGLQANYAPTHYWARYGTAERDSNTGYYHSFVLTDSLLGDYNTNLINTGAYLQYEMSPFDKLKLVAGVRVDNLTYQYKNNLSALAFSSVPDTTLSNFAFSPKIGLTYDIDGNSGVYANYSQGFSPPQTSDLFFGTSVPKLKPALFNNHEIGGWLSLMNKKMYIDASLYLMDGFNEIVSFRLPDNSTEYRNSGKTTHKGIEYSLTYRPGNDLFFRIGGTYAIHKYVDYEVQETVNKEVISYNGNFMPEAPKSIYNAAIQYKPHYLKGFRTSLEWQYIGPWYKDDANQHAYDDKTFLFKGSSFLNLRAAYQLKNIELYTNITNLTNELYANSVTRGGNNKDSYAAGAPRTFTFGIIYNFKKNNE